MMHAEKLREPGKIYHLRDVRWKELGAACAYTLDFYWEKHDGKTVVLSKLESPGTDMLARTKTARNVHVHVSILHLNDMHTTLSPSHYTSLT